MRSLLYRDGQNLREPADCVLSRREVVVQVQQKDRTYTMTIRDKASELDPYLVGVKAAAFSVRTGEPYMGRVVPREVRRALIHTNTSG